MYVVWGPSFMAQLYCSSHRCPTSLHCLVTHRHVLVIDVWPLFDTLAHVARETLTHAARGTHLTRPHHYWWSNDAWGLVGTFTLSFHMPCLFIYKWLFMYFYLFMTGPLCLYKEEPCFCKHKLNIEIESEVTLLNLSGFFVRLALLLFVLSCGSWKSSSGDTLTHLGAFLPPSKWCDHSHCLQPHKFLQLFIFFFHTHSISKTLKHVLFLVLYFQLVKCCYWMFLINSLSLVLVLIGWNYLLMFYSVHVLEMGFPWVSWFVLLKWVSWFVFLSCL